MNSFKQRADYSAVYRFDGPGVMAGRLVLDLFLLGFVAVYQCKAQIIDV